MAVQSWSSCILLPNTPPQSRITVKFLKLRAAAVPALDKDYKMRVPYELKKQGQSRIFHKLPSGLKMEVIYQKGLKMKEAAEEIKEDNSQKPPLVFVHGSFHAAWCWAEHWLPFFSGHGFDSYALSLLGQGESDAPAASVAGTLQTHAGDVADFIRNEIRLPPVLLGHSFGGLIVQYYLANTANEELQGIQNCYPKLARAALVCSVPPSGNSGIVWRYVFTKPIVAFKITRSLAAKAFQTSLSLCKETFFSKSMEDQTVVRYQKLMTESSRMPLFDLRKLNASLPVPSVRNNNPCKVLVLGANDDLIVDMEGVVETGKFYGVEPACLQGVAHDMMLDSSWEKGAQFILSWLNNDLDAPH